MATAVARIRSIQSRMEALQPRRSQAQTASAVSANVRRSAQPSVSAPNQPNFGNLLQAEISRYGTRSLSGSSEREDGSLFGSGGLSSLLGLGQLLNGVGGTADSFGLPAGFTSQPTSNLASLFNSNASLPRIAGNSVYKYNPFRDVEVTSPFGHRSLLGQAEEHRGTDFAVCEGTPLPAIGPGQVIRVGEDPVFGREVVFRLDSGEVIQYAHLTSESPYLVAEGQRVRVGEIVAISGDTGRSTGPHVHVSVQIADRYVDAQEFLAGLP